MEGIGRQDELNPSSEEEDLLSARYHLFGMRRMKESEMGPYNHSGKVLEILAEIGNVERKVILDTGAEINVIASHIVQLNGWKDRIRKNTEKYVGIGGKPTDVDGEITLSVQLTNRTVHETFVVIPVRHIVAILGTSFMLRHGVKISYRKNGPQVWWRPNQTGRHIEIRIEREFLVY